MIKKLTNKIIKFLQKNHAIPENEDEMTEVYQYGVEILLSSACNILLILLAGIVTCDLWNSLIFLGVMIPVRQFTGGYHAETYFRCNAVFLLTFLAVTVLSNLCYLYVDLIVMESILLLSLPLVHFLAPVPNIHKPLTEKERSYFRIIAGILYFLFSVIAVALWAIAPKHSLFTILTLLSIAVLMVIEIYMQRRGYHESNKSNR